MFEDLYRFWHTFSSEVSQESVEYPPHIVLCKACESEINVLEEAHLAYGGFYCLKEPCLRECSALRSIKIEVKEELIIGDRDD
jgi:hypothetical protein